MKKKIFKIITKRINKSCTKELFSLDIAIVSFKKKVNIEKIINNEFKTSFKNHLNEDITWEVVSYQELEIDDFLEKIKVKIRGESILVIFSQFFESMEEYHNFFEKPI